MITIEVNINDTIKVKLTQEGFQAAADAGYQYTATAVDEEEYSSWQLWVFMSVFGPHLFNGGQNMIESNCIRFVARPM